MKSLYQKKGGKIIEIQSLEHASWINLYPPFEHGELATISGELGIMVDLLTDSLDIDERSRFERDDDVRFILVNTPMLNDDDAKGSEAIYITVPVGIVMIKDKIVTICSRENPILERFSNGKVKHFDLDDKALFVLQLFEQNVYMFLDCLKKLNLKRNLIEQELYNSSRSSELKQLLRIEKSLVYFVNSLSTNDLLKMKMKRIDFLSISEFEYHTDLFEDVIIDNGQALEMSNIYTNILSGTMEAYASIISNNMNQFINRLTIITIMLMVPTLVASFYGMNLKNLPFSQSDYSFYFIIIISIIIGFGLTIFLRQKVK